MRKIKILLMGKSKSGKTSMKSIIFSELSAEETKHLATTTEIEQSHTRFYVDMVLCIWDCGGDEEYIDSYFGDEQNIVFGNVDILIYVTDVNNKDKETDLKYYQSCVEAIYKHSSSAKVYCLLHKIDLLQDDQKDQILSEYENKIISVTKNVNCVFFKTSIKNETLFRSWSTIMSFLVPNVNEIEKKLKLFADVLECNDILLFERSTLLVVSYYERSEHHDKQRFEKMSYTIKKFKLKCKKVKTELKFLELRVDKLTAFIDEFTPTTYIMIVMSTNYSCLAAIAPNIKHAKKSFEELERNATQVNQVASSSVNKSSSSSSSVNRSSRSNSIDRTSHSSSINRSSHSSSFNKSTSSSINRSKSTSSINRSSSNSINRSKSCSFIDSNCSRINSIKSDISSININHSKINSIKSDISSININSSSINSNNNEKNSSSSSCCGSSSNSNVS